MRNLILTLLILVTAQVAAQNTERTNISLQPDWGPMGYPLAEYYYIPALNLYYEVGTALFVLPDGNDWVRSESLPEEVKDTNLYDLYKVVMNGEEPWRNNRNHKVVYQKFAKRKKTRQTTLAQTR